MRGQALVGALFAGLAAYVSVRFLMRFFETRNLIPFAIYCLIAGAASATAPTIKRWPTCSARCR